MRSTRLLSSSRRLLGLDPLPVPPHAFAVDEERLLYGRFVRDDGQFDFQEFHEVALEPETFHPGPLGGLVREPEVLRGRLAALLETITVPVTDASLVVPDAWLRLSFAELEERPRRLAAAEEVLRWKLKRQVPFRVDDLRLRGMSAPPLGGRDGAHRVLLGYAMEQLLTQLEEAFADGGVRIGLVVNVSLAVCEALARRTADEERVGLLVVGSSGYSVAFTRGGRLVFHRFRAIGALDGGEAGAGLVQRDLRLTRDFLARETSEPPPDGFLVVAPPEHEARWLEWVAAAFELEPAALRPAHLPVGGAVPEPRLPDISPLLGAVCHQV